MGKYESSLKQMHTAFRVLLKKCDALREEAKLGADAPNQEEAFTHGLRAEAELVGITELLNLITK